MSKSPDRGAHEAQSIADEACGLLRWHWRERELLTEHAFIEITAAIRALAGPFPRPDHGTGEAE